MTQPVLKPVGQRPRCLHCDRELKPNFRRESMLHFTVPTGETVTVTETTDYYKGTKGERTIPLTRPVTSAERKQWRKDHPPVFLGTYGSYKDNRFCGLNCGYDWAVAHSRPATGAAR